MSQNVLISLFISIRGRGKGYVDIQGRLQDFGLGVA